MNKDRRRKLDKLVASNTLNANRNIMSGLSPHKDTLWWTLHNECKAIIKRFPSLA